MTGSSSTLFELTGIAGVDGLTSMVMVEPYSQGVSTSNVTVPALTRTGGPAKEKMYNQMSAAEKVKKCCLDFNKNGCSRSNTTCRSDSLIKN